MALTYRQAGVDIDAGEALVERIKPLARSTRIAEVVDDIGGFAGLCAVPGDVEEPLLVSGTDGVGTKLKVAFATGRHDTVGIDLVAMCVNDVVTTGARPLFFLDYFACGKLDVDVAAAVVSGIAAGCRQAARRSSAARRPSYRACTPRASTTWPAFPSGSSSRKAVLGPARVQPGDALARGGVERPAFERLLPRAARAGR